MESLRNKLDYERHLCHACLEHIGPGRAGRLCLKCRNNEDTVCVKIMTLPNGWFHSKHSRHFLSCDCFNDYIIVTLPKRVLSYLVGKSMEAKIGIFMEGADKCG